MNKKIILQAEQSFIATGWTSPTTTDNPDSKIVTAKVNLLAADGQKYDYPEIILWSGDAYDAIGQWTDADVQSRIAEIFA